MLGFDAAVEEVLKWVHADPSGTRFQETLIIVIPDHDTSGFAIKGPYGTLAQKGEYINEAWAFHDHTGQDTVIWSQGPGSQLLGEALNNTDINRVLKYALGINSRY